MPPFTPPAAKVLTDKEIVNLAIDAGYAVPENERHLAFGRAVVRAQLAKSAPSAIAQDDCGSYGYTADPCGPRREGPGPNPLRAPSTSPATDKDKEIRLLRKDLQQQRERNDELSHELVVLKGSIKRTLPAALKSLDLSDTPGNLLRRVLTVAGFSSEDAEYQKLFDAIRTASPATPWAYAIDVSDYKRVLDETAEGAAKQAAHFRGRGRTVAVTPLGPMAASPAALTDERIEAAASIIAAHLLGQPQRDDVEWVAHSIRTLLAASPADQEQASQEVK